MDTEKMTYLKKDWEKFDTHSDATETRGKIKIDYDGNMVEWVHGGKRVKTKILNRGEHG